MHSICRNQPHIEISAEQVRLQQDGEHCATFQHIVQLIRTVGTVPTAANLNFNFEKNFMVDRFEVEQAKTE